ncbi:MAG: sensor histidine kinase [Candidatus Limnocylindria bacterium]
MTLRLRVALLTAAAVALVEVAIVASIYGFASDRLYAQVEQDLQNAAFVIVPVVEATGDLPVRPAQDPERAPNIRRLIAADGRVLNIRSPVDLPVTASARRVASGDLRRSLETLSVAAESFYVLSVPAGRDRAVQTARSLAPVEDVLRQLLLASLAFGAAGIVAALLAGTAVATGALAPLRRLSDAVGGITRRGDLTQRVGARGRDELATFARSFDAMLDRLEEMVQEVESARRMQRQLVADASHELRAPLATLRTNVELLSLGNDAPIGDREGVLADTLAGIEDLTRLVGQLIDLAREDQRVHERASVRLDQLVLEELDRARRRYPAVQFVARIDPATVLGDVEALTRAVANLLDNAGKWSPSGGTVDVDLHERVLEVRDQGPGIDGVDLPRIFERFYRGSRATGVPGSGLGLAIVAQVMASHGGQISARSSAGQGTVFTATFSSAAS